MGLYLMQGEKNAFSMQASQVLLWVKLAQLGGKTARAQMHWFLTLEGCVTIQRPWTYGSVMIMAVQSEK
jgi:hypothetical protein